MEEGRERGMGGMEARLASDSAGQPTDSHKWARGMSLLFFGVATEVCLQSLTKKRAPSLFGRQAELIF